MKEVLCTTELPFRPYSLGTTYVMYLYMNNFTSFLYIFSIIITKKSPSEEFNTQFQNKKLKFY